MSEEFKLCYVEENFAYFTTQELSKQWGDDWNDAPYEHNAGRPYTPSPNSKKDWSDDGTPKWSIKKVAYEGPFNQPCDNYLNSPYSVEAINKGEIAWLFTDRWVKKPISIKAGVSLQEFTEIVRNAGGEVYLPMENKPAAG